MVRTIGVKIPVAVVGGTVLVNRPIRGGVVNRPFIEMWIGKTMTVVAMGGGEITCKVSLGVQVGFCTGGGVRQSPPLLLPPEEMGVAPTLGTMVVQAVAKAQVGSHTGKGTGKGTGTGTVPAGVSTCPTVTLYVTAVTSGTLFQLL
jgi:hypothetical protein